MTRPAEKPGPAGGVGGGSKFGRRKRQSGSSTTSTWNLKDRTVKDALGKCLYQAKVGSIKKGMSRDVFGDLMKGYLCGEIEVLNGTVANLTSWPAKPDKLDCATLMNSTDWTICKGNNGSATADLYSQYCFSKLRWDR